MTNAGKKGAPGSDRFFVIADGMSTAETPHCCGGDDDDDDFVVQVTFPAEPWGLESGLVLL